jgi:hypothetical protein
MVNRPEMTPPLMTSSVPPDSTTYDVSPDTGLETVAVVVEPEIIMVVGI